MTCRLLSLLLIALALGGCGMSDSGSSQDHPFDHPENVLSDEQTRAQVVDPAVQVVHAVALDDVTGVQQGWTSGAPEGQVVHGDSLNRDGVTATVGPRPSDPGYGALQLYGECRNTGDHGSEGAVDITDQLR